MSKQRYRYFVTGTILVDGKEKVYQDEVASETKARMRCGASETVLIRYQCKYCGDWVALPNPCPCKGWR